MPIRDYLKRRLRLANLVLALGLALIACTLLARAAIDPYELMRKYRGEYITARVAGIAVILIGVYMQRRIKCPNCGTHVAISTFTVVAPDSCSVCKVNFDEPMPHIPISP
jgi:hypothetical protein